jgi:hypothetical protein
MKQQANAIGRFRDHRAHFLLKTIVALGIGFFLFLGSGAFWINTKANGIPIKPQSEIDTSTLQYP